MTIYMCPNCEKISDPSEIKRHDYGKYEVFACPRCESENIEVINYKEYNEKEKENF